MKRGGGRGGGDLDGQQGEIIQVQGGHIIRATGRKDRHSKVYTSKGPRDRRVRLSAHTAIQFYDVQDRLGYDRPSKAVDWLIKKAKTAIDNLAELPGGHNNQANLPNDHQIISPVGGTAPSTDSNPDSSSFYGIQRHHHQMHEDPNGNISQTVDVHSIGDSMKSFFPVSPGNSLMNMHSYHDERTSRQQPSIQNDDLGLSLHSNLGHRSYTEQMLFSGSGQNMFPEANYEQKTESWSGGGEGENRNMNGNIGFIFSPHSMPVPQHLIFSQNSAFSSHREPLQSNNYSQQLFHAWNDQRQMMSSVDHHQNAAQAAINQSSMYNIHFGSDFQIPARIRGDEESPSSQH